MKDLVDYIGETGAIDQALTRLTYGLYVTGAMDTARNRFAGSTVDAVIQVSADPRTLLFSSNKANNTTDCILKAGEFTLSVLPQDVHPFVIANFGYQSSREVDKWANIPHDMLDGLPVIPDALCALHLRVLQDIDAITHTLYLCQVLNVKMGSDDGRIPLTYSYYQQTLKGKVGAAFSDYKAGKPIAVQSTGNTEAAAVPKAPQEKANGQWTCGICGYVYDGQTPFKDLPDDYKCPWCGAPKSVFELK